MRLWHGDVKMNNSGLKAEDFKGHSFLPFNKPLVTDMQPGGLMQQHSTTLQQTSIVLQGNKLLIDLSKQT